MTQFSLPKRANLENLKKRAKNLLKSAHSGDQITLEQIAPYFGNPENISLQQAQLVIARQYGFSSWKKLKHHLETKTPNLITTEQIANEFLDLVTVVYGSKPDIGPKRFQQAAELLAQHPDITNENIYTTAAIGDVEKINYWLDKDPQCINRKGGLFNWEPIMYAAYARLPGMSTLNAGLKLLERGADPNAHYMWGEQYKFTALTGVFGQGEAGPIRQPEHPDYEQFAHALLKAGADPNDSQAAYNRCFEKDNKWLKILLDYGLNDHDRNNWFEKENDKFQPVSSHTMHFHLIHSIKQGNLERAKLLIDHGVNLNKPDDSYDTRIKGKTPYEAAMLLGEIDIANLLIKAGAHQTNLSPLDQLQAGCIAANEALVNRIIDQNPNILTQVNTTELLQDAIKSSKISALKLMIKLGFNLNEKSGQTPLHTAALNGNVDIAKILIDAGADPTIRDQGHKMPPIGFAEYMNNEDMVTFLMTQKMDIFTASAKGNLEQIKARLNENNDLINIRFSDIHPKDHHSEYNWMTPLVYAVLTNKTDAVKFLLENGAERNVTDGKENSLAKLVEKHENSAMREIFGVQ